MYWKYIEAEPRVVAVSNAAAAASDAAAAENRVLQPKWNFKIGSKNSEMTIAQERHVIKVERFEGPLDALLRMIEEQKLSINEVALAEVADQYIVYLRSQRVFPLREVADFLAIASTLILIKSKTLLPSLALTEEETESIGELERRLKLYEQFGRLAKELERAFGAHPLFAREFSFAKRVGFVEPRGLTIEQLALRLRGVVSALPFAESFPERLIERVVSLEEKIREIRERILREATLSFRDLTASSDKMGVIVGFLALLELVKQGLFDVEQRGAFDHIHISSTHAHGEQS